MSGDWRLLGGFVYCCAFGAAGALEIWWLLALLAMPLVLAGLIVFLYAVTEGGGSW